ncbi:MAG: helix-turn-helix transcriptional regulator [Hafnia sp.]
MSNSLTQGEKLRLIRESERLNRRELAAMVGLVYGTYAGYEGDKMKMSFEAGIRLFKHPRFNKYQDWFMYGRVNPATGQIAPALAHCGQDGTILQQSENKAG